MIQGHHCGLKRDDHPNTPDRAVSLTLRTVALHVLGTIAITCVSTNLPVRVVREPWRRNYACEGGKGLLFRGDNPCEDIKVPAAHI